MENQKQTTLNLLLLTNRDWDNLGDKVMEACDIALLHTVMRNIGIADYSIDSRDADLISPQYLQTRDARLLKPAEDAVRRAGIIIFGGAPMFNYVYQNFYERTAILIELAEKYGKPVIFSAIGIEGYDESNPKCQRLKQAVNSDCVKQITARDGYDFLKQYICNPQITIEKVADSAVFTSNVFAGFSCQKSEHRKKKIGIFVLRANGFKDNHIDFSKEDSCTLWQGLIQELEDRGYEYELLTSGHFGDEAFLQFFMTEYAIPAEKCIFNMDTPEKLVQKISSYDAIISCRLHPNIVAFSLEVPAIGIVWNSKVRDFYHNIGYENRALETMNLSPQSLINQLESAMGEGVKKDNAYLLSAYASLYNGICSAICSDGNVPKMYDYEELIKNIPLYNGSSPTEQASNYERKLKRIYEKYNSQTAKLLAQKEIITNLKNEVKAERSGFAIVYRSGTKSNLLSWNYDETKGSIQKLTSGSIEYRTAVRGHNDGTTLLQKNEFLRPESNFKGWHVRIKCNHIWYWLLEDLSLLPVKEVTENTTPKMILADESLIPVIPVPMIQTILLEATWKKKPAYTILYNSGIKSPHIKSRYTKEDGTVSTLPSGSVELKCPPTVSNNHAEHFMENKFSCRGYEFVCWRLRVKIDQQWYWYLSDGSLFPKDNDSASNPNAPIQAFIEEEPIPGFPNLPVKTLVAEAVWKKKK